MNLVTNNDNDNEGNDGQPGRPQWVHHLVKLRHCSTGLKIIDIRNIFFVFVIIIVLYIIISIISTFLLTYQVSVTPANADKALGPISRGKAH